MFDRWWIIIAAVVLLGGSLSAGNNKLISGVDVDVMLVEAPEVEYKSGKKIASKSGAENRWLMVQVEFTARNAGEKAKPQLTRSGKGYVLQMGGFVDDLQLGVRVLQNTGLSVSGKPLWGMYTGETRFYTVRLDGKKHLALMFVPAKLIDRYSGSVSGDIRKLNKDDFKVEVVFSVNGRELARKYRGVSGTESFEELCRMVPVNMVMNDGVFPRSRTPWAYLGSENFDLERDRPVPQHR